MAQDTTRYMFPRWTTLILPAIVIAVVGGALYVPVLIGIGFSPKATDVGYAPEQPVPYSHAIHVGKLGMDCRYCHTTVAQADFAAIPATQTCMNCHTNVLANSTLLAPVRDSIKTGLPIPWVKIHDLPDYVYFNHSAHVNKGVGCVSCHGQVDQMEVVYQHEPLSMGWCLDCHREPENHLRPKEHVTNMSWKPENGDQLAIGRKLKDDYGIRPKEYMTSCSTCHR